MDNKNNDGIIKKILNAEINISISNDGFIIVSEWDDIEKIEGLINTTMDESFDKWGFSDEYTLCYDCNGIIQINPYDKIDYAILDNEVICGNCIRDEKNDYHVEYIETLINNPKKANTILKDAYFENNNFKKCNCKGEICAFSAGLREGSNDNPKEIIKNAIARNPDKNFVFDITNVDMFDIQFSLWSKDKETDE